MQKKYFDENSELEDFRSFFFDFDHQLSTKLSNFLTVVFFVYESLASVKVKEMMEYVFILVVSFMSWFPCGMMMLPLIAGSTKSTNVGHSNTLLLLTNEPHMQEAHMPDTTEVVEDEPTIYSKIRFAQEPLGQTGIPDVDPVKRLAFCPKPILKKTTYKRRFSVPVSHPGYELRIKNNTALNKNSPMLPIKPEVPLWKLKEQAKPERQEQSKRPIWRY